MITINNIKYIPIKREVSWLTFSKTYNGHKIHGESPFINFYITDDSGKQNNISIETTYPKEELLSMQEGKIIAFSKYISDITYTENGRWDSLIIGTFSSTLCKLEQNKFQITLACYYEALNYIVDLQLEEVITI